MKVQGMKRRELLRTSVYCGAAAISSPALHSLVFTAGPNAPEAATTAGRVRGYTKAGIHVFKGIPYGADTAPRRFMAPAHPTPWTGVRETIDFGPRAPQASG